MTKPTLVTFNQIAPLIVQQYESYLPSAFDESFTLLQKVNKIISHLNQIGELSNEVLTKWNEVIEWVTGEGVNETVSTRLDEMVLDGTFDSIINETIFNDLNTEINGKASQSEVTTLSSAVTTLSSNVDKKNDGVLNASEYITKTSNDHTLEFQSLINASITNGYKEIDLPAMTIKLTDTIILPQAFLKQIIKGRGYRNTILDFSGMSSGKSMFLIKGGSGQFSGGMLRDVRLTGLNTHKAIEVQGVCGYKIKDVQIDVSEVGILLHNFENNEFTEYVVGENVDFTSNCKVALEYKRTNGAESFHGSGLKGCTINEPETTDRPAVVIGGNCRPYNAPLDFSIWKRTGQPIVNNWGSSSSSFHGDISVEIFNAGLYTKTEVCGSLDNPIFIAGHLLALDNNTHVRMGSAIYCDRIQQNVDGSVTIQRKPFQFKWNLQTGTSHKILTPQNNQTLLANVHLNGNNFEYTYTLLLYKNPNDENGVITTLATPRAFDGNSWGVPTLTFENGALTVAHPQFPAMQWANAYVSVVEIGSRFQYYLQ